MCELDRVRRPVGREDVRATGGGGERGEREAAAELDDAGVREVAPGNLACEHLAARPELGPVREKLLVLESVLVQQGFGVAWPQDRERPRRQLDVDFDEVEAHWRRVCRCNEKRSPWTPRVRGH